jgi:uncharacterized protein YbbK (DUF523 family)
VKLVSACLLGIGCNYRGGSWPDPALAARLAEGGLFPVCPEVLGGLAVPRRPAEIQGGDGNDVLDGRARVVDDEGRDVTARFLAGAEAAAGIAKSLAVDEALLVELSPSCGCGAIYDGTFSGTRRAGDGVTAALLKRRGIKVTSVPKGGRKPPVG